MGCAHKNASGWIPEVRCQVGLNLGTQGIVDRPAGQTQTKNGHQPLVLNLCDGDEVNGVPGVSVIDALQEEGLVYTGSDQHFYTITTSKIPMKRAFDKAGVSTAPWKLISGEPASLQGVCEQVGTPIIF